MCPRTHVVACIQCCHQRHVKPFGCICGDASALGSGGNKNQRCVTTKEQLLACGTNQKGVLSLNQAVNTPHNGVLLVTTAEKMNRGLEEFSVVIFLISNNEKSITFSFIMKKLCEDQVCLGTKDIPLASCSLVACRNLIALQQCCRKIVCFDHTTPSKPSEQ